MKASMDLIAKLRGQLPPEAMDKLDELEGMLAEEGAEGEEGLDEDEPADMPADVNSSASEEGDLDELMGDEPADKPAPVAGSAAKKKPAKKPSFFS